MRLPFSPGPHHHHYASLIRPSKSKAPNPKWLQPNQLPGARDPCTATAKLTSLSLGPLHCYIQTDSLEPGTPAPLRYSALLRHAVGGTAVAFGTAAGLSTSAVSGTAAGLSTAAVSGTAKPLAKLVPQCSSTRNCRRSLFTSVLPSNNEVFCAYGCGIYERAALFNLPMKP